MGVPSHLLWWIHVLPVALITYRVGRTGAAAALVIGAALVGTGERTFGNGPGVAPELGDRVFDPFVTTKASGTGLGLAISRRLVGSMGGSLTVGRAPAGGARFTLRLPLSLPRPTQASSTRDRVAV